MEAAIVSDGFRQKRGQPDEKIGRLGAWWLQVALWGWQRDSLRRSATSQLKGLEPSRLQWRLQLLKWAVVVLQVGLIGLTYYSTRWHWNFGSTFGIVNDSVLTGLWQVEATTFGLVAAFAPLVIATASDPVDRGRMIRRYRKSVFNWFLILGLMTLLLTGGEVLFLPSAGTSGGRAGTALWLGLSLLVLLGALAGTIIYTYRLITTTSEERLEWLVEEALDYQWSSLVDAYALNWLRGWVKRADRRNEKWALLGSSGGIQVEFDVRLLETDEPLVFLAGDQTRSVYISDISLRRLSRWLTAVAPDAGNGPLKICIAGFLHRRLKPGIPIAAMAAGPPDETAGVTLEGLRRAYVLKDSSPSAFFYRAAFKDLRDKASAAARAGKIAEFELLLATLTRIAVRYYALAEELERRHLFSTDEFRTLNLEPRAALRAVVHELGEEIFATRSPNVLKAWLHYPHSVMESSRYHPARNESAAMYAWFRAANLIREPRKDLEDIRPLVLESLRRRLLTYGQDVAAAIGNRQGVRRRRRWTFEREAEWYVRTLGKLLSVVAETERTSVVREVTSVIQKFPGPEQYLGAMWIECARHVAADFINPELSCGSTANAFDLEMSIRHISAKFDGLRGLMKSWRLLSLTEESREQSMSVIYQQLIDMTWDEQMELGKGVFDPLLPPYRGKLGISLLALNLASCEDIRCLPFDDDAVQLFNLADRDTPSMAELKKLAGAAGCDVDVAVKARTIMACAAHEHVAPKAVADGHLAGTVFVEFDGCLKLIDVHTAGTGIDGLTHDLQRLLDGARQLGARAGAAPFRINAENFDQVWRRGSTDAGH